MEEENKNEDVLEKRKNKLKNFFFGWVEDNYDRVFIGILILAFIIRFWIFLKTKDQAIWYDAASFLATAKKWAWGLDVNSIWYFRRGFFWVLFSAFFFKIGLGETAIRFMITLFSTGIVFITYFLIKSMFNKKVALLTCTGVTFSWVFLFFSGRPMTSIPATFFLLLSVLFFWKGYVLKEGNKFIYLFSVFYALAVLTRLQYLLFILPFLVLIFTKEKFRFLKNKSLWITLLIFFIMLIPHLILYSMNYGFFIIDIFHYYLGLGDGGSVASSASVKTFSDLFDYFIDLPYLLSKPLFFLFLIGSIFFFADFFLGIDKIFKSEKIRVKLFIFLFIVTTFITLGRITEIVEQRYVMPTLPFLILISITPLLKLEKILIKHMKINPKLGTSLIIIILIALLIPNFLWANNLIENKKNSYLELKQAGLWLKEYSNPGDVILSRSMPQIIYYAERPTYTTGSNESLFEQNIRELNPRFLILSIFEVHQPWEYSYPQQNNNTLIPIKVYQKDGQPILIIYEFNTSDVNKT